ncbi:acyl-CoA N-acyltransferase [Hyaloraphidium curvatum]|nr:acyl-CoA N-acyltransferase [Hyaloraphidium curvatum]
MSMPGGTFQHRSFFLELESPAAFRPKPFPRADVVLACAEQADAELCRELWTEVGRTFWTEREEWTVANWRDHLAWPGVHFGIASVPGEPVGFFELVFGGECTQLEGFGLLPAWRGHGLGGGLLSAATRQALADGAVKIRLHTATDDHPHALPNYLARGYRVYHEEELAHPIRTMR